VQIINADCRTALKGLADASVNCCVTSPPYFGLRDYDVAGQIGLELTPDAFVAELVDVFREVRRVLREDGSLWVNMGDTYQNAKGQSGGFDPKQPARRHLRAARPQDRTIPGLKPKDLIGVPWMLAFALRADGWYLREEIIWNKPNAMPDPTKDRCTRSQEHIFHLSKSRRYYHDGDAIKEPAVSDHGSGNGFARPARLSYQNTDGTARGNSEQWTSVGGMRNKRSVWTVPTKPFAEAHFAVFPPDLVEPCILASCPEGGTVLDPFGGAGTTALVADRHNRNAILIELNPEYAALARRRIDADAPLLAAS
jgi:DNA modification methylase